MSNHNPTNERLKRQYFAFLTDAQGYSDASIDAVAKAIARFEAYTRYKDFKVFHVEQAKGFKRDLADQPGRRNGEPLSKATLYATLTALKRFFIWLAGQTQLTEGPVMTGFATICMAAPRTSRPMPAPARARLRVGRDLSRTHGCSDQCCKT